MVHVNTLRVNIIKPLYKRILPLLEERFPQYFQRAPSHPPEVGNPTGIPVARQKNEFSGFCAYPRRLGPLYVPASIRMETFKPILPSRGRAALLATACLVFPLTAGEPAGGKSLAERELSRRSAVDRRSQELLRKGDEAYQAGRYSEAVEAYAGARDLIPDAPVSAELRQAATERYAQASVEQARVLSRKGDVAGAKAAVDKVLLEGVAPNDPGALAIPRPTRRSDPHQSRPDRRARQGCRRSAAHSFTLRKVRSCSGNSTRRNTHYEQVLRIDPTNSAARRGMEQVAAAKSGYQKAAYDQTRAEMLSQVDAAWETQISAPDLGVGPEDPGGLPIDFGKMSDLRQTGPHHHPEDRARSGDSWAKQSISSAAITKWMRKCPSDGHGREFHRQSGTRRIRRSPNHPRASSSASNSPRSLCGRF